MAAVPGINCLSQDTAACLLADGRLVAVAEDERFSPRVAHQGLPGRGDPLLLAAGFLPAEISHTSTNLSGHDFGALLRHPGVRLNLDLVSQVERLGQLAPGREIGRRLNPRAGAFSERTRSAARYRDRTGRRSPASTPFPGSSAVPRCCAAALGYVQIDPRGAELLFQIITERDEHASIRIGTNLPFR